ncbi:hypothetical protein RF11_05089 [Thelohanellus kitauei]|uniref:Uncharacterized protein n=1 Tax=Thelohanellus kitauei TaxID=669202 RepID=A0A0C2J452_THEKT|nr:hypothetical protein RF11_05089 [Thelohanellus kitauei]
MFFIDKNFAQNPQSVSRNYREQPETVLEEAVLKCAFADSKSASTLLDKDVMLECCYEITKEELDSRQGKLSEEKQKELGDQRSDDCPAIDEGFKECLALDDVLPKLDQYFKRRYIYV